MLEGKPRTDGMSLDRHAYAGSRRYRTALPNLSAQSTASLIEKYPAGSSVSVYYANADLLKAVLARGNPPTLSWLLSTSLLFTTLGLRLACKAE